MPKFIGKKFINAQRHLQGGLFVSHSGRDWEPIERLIRPIVYDHYKGALFIENQRTAPPNTYVNLVQAALHWCSRFMVIVSENTVRHVWVREEVDCAIQLRRPILVCLLDDSDAAAIHPDLTADARPRRTWTIDVREPEKAQQKMRRMGRGKVFQREL